MNSLFFIHTAESVFAYYTPMICILHQALVAYSRRTTDCETLHRLHRMHPITFPPLRHAPCDNATAPLSRRLTRAIPNEYIVVMRDNHTHVTTQSVGSTSYRTGTTLSIVQTLKSRDHRSADEGFVASIRRMYTNVFVGFSAFLSPNAVELVLEDPDVLLVEYDSIVSTRIDQINPIWNLDRIDQSSMILNGRYDTGDLSGKGVHLYILDTGIASRHQEFVGRLGQGKSFVRNDPSWEDCNGHGTHCASTAAGTRWGVAKGATVHGVRVLNCEGSGAWSSIIGGLDWVIGDSKRWPLTSVASMSLGGDFSSVLNRAVESAVQQGLFVTVAAGNENKDACATSPASEPMAVTVGSTAKGDIRSSFSNFGRCVDIYAPGSFIKAADYQSSTGSAILSGTSMATPHIAGTAALMIEDQQTRADPEAVWSSMKLLASTGIPFPSSVFLRTPMRRGGAPAPNEDDDEMGACTTLEDRRCVFPFVFLGKRYTGCTADEDRDGRKWCSVRVDGEERHIRGNWGYCNPETCDRPKVTPSPTPSSTIPTCGTSDGRTCVFPFRFRGETYTDCTTQADPDGRYWCSTSTDARGKHVMGKWGYCDMSCLRSADAPLSVGNEQCDLYHSINQLRVQSGHQSLALDDHLQKRALEHATAILFVDGAYSKIDASNTYERMGATVGDVVHAWNATAMSRQRMLCDDCTVTGVAVVTKGTGWLMRRVFVQVYDSVTNAHAHSATSFRDVPLCKLPTCRAVSGERCVFPTNRQSCVRRQGSWWCHTDTSPITWRECDSYTCSTGTMRVRLGGEPLLDRTLGFGRVVEGMRRNIRTLIVLGGVTVGVLFVLLLLAMHSSNRARLSQTPSDRHDE